MNFEYELTEIADIECLGECDEEVYDVGMVETPHTFFANDLLVHNSCFLSAKPIIDKLEEMKGVTTSYNERAKITFNASQKVQDYINAQFDDFALDHFNVKTHYWKFKQEYVAEAAIWISKKRYAQKIISEKGVLISDMTKGSKTYKLDVKGLDVVRSNFPKKFRSYMSDMLLRLLNGVQKDEIDTLINEFRTYVMTIDTVTDIMPVSTVKDMEKWSETDENGIVIPKSGTPVHVKAAINYNNFLIINKLNSSRPIISTNKIKWAYISENEYGYETIAIPVEHIDEEAMQFLTQHLNNKLIYDKILTKKLEAYYDAMKWGAIPKNSALYKYFNF